MDATGSVLIRLSSLFERAKHLSEIQSSWPDRRRIESPAPPARVHRGDERLIAVCSDAGALRRFLSSVAADDAALFRAYFLERRSAGSIVRRERVPLWKVYERLNELADRFLEFADLRGTPPARDPRTGRFASRNRRAKNSRPAKGRRE